MEPCSRQTRYHICNVLSCLRWTTMHCWVGISLAALFTVASATSDELLQQKVTPSPITAIWNVAGPSSSPNSEQSVDTSLSSENSNGNNGNTTSFIVFSSILLFGAASFLLVSYQRCRQNTAQKFGSEWYLENSLPTIDTSNSCNRSDETYFAIIEEHHSTSMDITEPDDEVNEFYKDDVESVPSIHDPQDILASFHMHHNSDGPFVQDLSIQLHDYDSDDNENIESDDEYDTSNLCDFLQQNDFDHLWNQDDEFDDDFDDSGSHVQTGPIDIDSGEYILFSVPTAVATMTISTTTMCNDPLRATGDKKRRRDYHSSLTTISHGPRTIRKKRHKTVKTIREDYFYEKYNDRVRRLKELQPIPESSENDDNTSVSSAGISYRSKPRTVATGAADDPNDAITESTIPSQIMECYPDTVIV